MSFVMSVLAMPDENVSKKQDLAKQGHSSTRDTLSLEPNTPIRVFPSL